MKNTSELKVGDYIAFKWNYGLNQGRGGDLITDQITFMSKDRVLVHFMYGLKSESEYVNKNDILAIGNMKGVSKLKGFKRAKFDILKSNHPLIIDNLVRNSHGSILS